MAKTICIDGRLMDFSTPRIMGIINATPDSFFPGSRTPEAEGAARRALRHLADGADILDVGGYSSRPGAEHIPADEEYSRLAGALEAIRRVAPDAVISVDTFRATVARKCVEEWGVQIINDISGGTLDPGMAETVADLQVPYVLMHTRGTPQTMASLTGYADVTAEVLSDLAFKAAALRRAGVADIILDPGFGFAKTPEESLRLLGEMDAFAALDMPLLAGVSRKSMVWRTLGVTPDESLNGTTALHMAALLKGADILRAHDVKEAAQCAALFKALRHNH
ncbi:MAG: dihydropteroate synthase [Bacteroides sp.]|nr:dihydropteroate synthase [Bacteroides sp.]